MNISAASAVTLLSRASEQKAASRDDGQLLSSRILASANGTALPKEDAAASPFEKAKASNDFFSVTAPPSVNEMKLELYDGVGKIFGIKRKDFKEFAQFARAIDQEVFRIGREGGVVALMKLHDTIDQELELGKLGVSAREVLKAMIDPMSAADDKLTEALEKKIRDTKSADLSLRIQKDDIGLYSATRA